MNRMVKMLIVALIISVGAQFSLNLFVDGFIITLAVVILPVILYKNHDLHPVWTCLLTAIVSPLFRAGILYLQARDATIVAQMVYPDIVFYVTYGLVFTLLYWRKEEGTTTDFLIAVFFADLVSNLFEMGVRTRVTGMDDVILKGLALIAFGRMLMVFAIVVYLRWYQSFLVKEEHEERYRRLMALTATFKSEIYFMQKNMQQIEKVMKRSFKSYKMAEQEQVSPQLQGALLDISKDVHEIKKDYIRVIQGLEQGFSEKMAPTEISLKDLVNMLEMNTQEYLESLNSPIRLRCKSGVDMEIKSHYYLMSILRNLVNNAIEACAHEAQSTVEVQVDQEEGNLVMRVADNGSGIAEDVQAYVFNLGFSTKFNAETGDIGRGIGLTMVHSLITETFGGTIDLVSAQDQGTTFTIHIPLENLEVA